MNRNKRAVLGTWLACVVLSLGISQPAAHAEASSKAKTSSAASQASAHSDSKSKSPSANSSKSGSSQAKASSKDSAKKSGAAKDAPAGNNGTIKIKQWPADSTPSNQPHVSCQFGVNFYGYDAGTQTATLSFVPQSPTTGGQTVNATTSWTVATRTGGNQLDHTYGPVDLTAAFAGVAPHPQQGYHVKLTVHVTGSQGSDVKHKVFWFQPCTGEEEEVGGNTGEQGSGTDVGGTNGTVTPTTGAGGVTTPVGGIVPEVLGEVINRSTLVPGAQTGSSSIGGKSSTGTAVTGGSPTEVLGATLVRGALATTGTSVITFALVALALIAVGLYTRRSARRRTPQG